jgi:hypothetical protein
LHPQSCSILLLLSDQVLEGRIGRGWLTAQAINELLLVLTQQRMLLL